MFRCNRSRMCGYRFETVDFSLRAYFAPEMQADSARVCADIQARCSTPYMFLDISVQWRLVGAKRQEYSDRSGNRDVRETRSQSYLEPNEIVRVKEQYLHNRAGRACVQTGVGGDRQEAAPPNRTIQKGCGRLVS